MKIAFDYFHCVVVAAQAIVLAHSIGGGGVLADCIEEFNPCRCRSDNVVYINTCLASEAGCYDVCDPVDADCLACDPVKCKKRGDKKDFKNECLANLDGYKKCKERKPSFCPTVVDPVVCDGLQYNNQCEAYNACLYEEGDCEKPTGPIICPAVSDPCVACGFLYSNPCYASAAGCRQICMPVDEVCPKCKPVICKGEKGGEKVEFRNRCQAKLFGYNKCKKRQPGFCPAVFLPVVCGEKETQYGNQCEAFQACLYTSEDCEDVELPSNVPDCPNESAPCKCDGTEYPNPCRAEQDGCDGECEPSLL